MLVEDLQRREIDISIRETLGSKSLTFKDDFITISEARKGTPTAVDFMFYEISETSQSPIAITSKGRGFIDAIFKGMVDQYAEKYPSLNQIKLKKFTVSTPGFLDAETASDVEVSLRFEISNNSFTFSNVSNSIVRSAYCNLLETFQFYINCEKCFFLLRDAVKDAQSRNRSDIVSACSYKMSNLTKMISYEKICK
tara:strand:+ start:53934 stop:54521 length:588 start_codon:yes stop_codon:yes gene_type:complete